jgi:hypothetical protein
MKPATPDVSDAGLQPWQFFVLAALGCATAVTFMVRGQGPIAVILLGVMMAAAALVGYARAARSGRWWRRRRPHGDGRISGRAWRSSAKTADAAVDQGAGVRSRDGPAVRRGLGRDVGAAARAPPV